MRVIIPLLLAGTSATDLLLPEHTISVGDAESPDGQSAIVPITFELVDADGTDAAAERAEDRNPGIVQHEEEEEEEEETPQVPAEDKAAVETSASSPDATAEPVDPAEPALIGGRHVTELEEAAEALWAVEEEALMFEFKAEDAAAKVKSGA